MNEIECTYCGEQFTEQQEDDDRYVECPHCNQTNVVEPDSASDQDVPEAESVAGPSSDPDPSPRSSEEDASPSSSATDRSEQEASSSDAQSQHGSEPDPPRQDVSAWGVVSLIFGVLSLPASCLFCILGCFPGAVAIATGWVGIHKTSKEENKNSGRGMAIAGVITGIIGFLISAFFLLGIFVPAFYNAELKETQDQEIEVEVPEERNDQPSKNESDSNSRPSPDEKNKQ